MKRYSTLLCTAATLAFVGLAQPAAAQMMPPAGGPPPGGAPVGGQNAPVAKPPTCTETSCYYVIQPFPVPNLWAAYASVQAQCGSQTRGTNTMFGPYSVDPSLVDLNGFTNKFCADYINDLNNVM